MNLSDLIIAALRDEGDPQDMGLNHSASLADDYGRNAKWRQQYSNLSPSASNYLSQQALEERKAISRQSARTVDYKATIDPQGQVNKLGSVWDGVIKKYGLKSP